MTWSTGLGADRHCGEPRRAREANKERVVSASQAPLPKHPHQNRLTERGNDILDLARNAGRPFA